MRESLKGIQDKVMVDVVRVALLRKQIIEALPDKDVALFNEYNELLANTFERMTELNNQQDELLKKVAFRTDN